MENTMTFSDLADGDSFVFSLGVERDNRNKADHHRPGTLTYVKADARTYVDPWGILQSRTSGRAIVWPT